MKKKIPIYFILLLLGFAAIGCIENPEKRPVEGEISVGAFDNYEFYSPDENFTNSTTVYINSNRTVKVVSSLVNASNLEIILPEDVSSELRSKKGPGIEDLVVVGNISLNLTDPDLINFSNISYNATYARFSRKRVVDLEFDQPATGFAAYSYSAEYSQFYLMVSRDEIIHIVLPAHHDTGNLILGSPRPAPDEKFKDEGDRVHLIWNEPYPEQTFIWVKYYSSSLPVVLGILGLMLVAGFTITALYYGSQIRKLQEKRRIIESKMEKKR